MRATILFLAAGALVAQVPNPTQRPPADQQMQAQNQPVPIFRTTVVARTTKAINYHHRTGTTHIAFQGTALMPAARGEAAVESRMGSTKVDTTLQHMSPPNQFGPEYMTYVMWGITPEGRPVNLGEVVLEGDHAQLLSTTELQAFGLIVTAEPYYSVTQPSDVVVAENIVRKDTAGTIEEVDAKYELLQRGQYVLDHNRYQPIKVDPKGPLQIAEAENAVEIASLAGADRYAPDTMQRARVNLQNAEGFLFGRSKDRKEAETNAREAAQTAEDARIITYRKIVAEQTAATQASERDAQARADEAAAQAKLEQERRASAEADRLAAERERMQAQAAASQAQAAAAQSAQEKAAADAARAAADAARAAALQQQQAAEAEAERARLAAQSAETEKGQLREKLREQLNSILETRETARGLIVNISDVLFDFNKYTLKPGAREKMAKVSGILLAYPGLKIQLEGHTDAIGSEDYNQKLSEQRADAVREYLVGQGVPGATVTAVGFGKSRPVADNSTAEGRQQNRRVEMVVSGASIGVGSMPAPETPRRER
jgi:outer membrane protein OmpA-like peptidoglycan-associated protein